MQSLTIKPERKRGFTLLISHLVTMVILLSCSSKDPAIFGTYRLYSEDPSVQKWIAGENTFLKVNIDKTIIYNSTMNGKQRFHFEGSFNLDSRTNTLSIRWKDGRLPGKMQIERKGSDYIIQIGTTTYKKENPGGS
jgi:hypothetical protein